MDDGNSIQQVERNDMVEHTKQVGNVNFRYTHMFSGQFSHQHLTLSKLTSELFLPISYQSAEFKISLRLCLDVLDIDLSCRRIILAPDNGNVLMKGKTL
jgi:hypothetical protein